MGRQAVHPVVVHWEDTGRILRGWEDPSTPFDRAGETLGDSRASTHKEFIGCSGAGSWQGRKGKPSTNIRRMSEGRLGG